MFTNIFKTKQNQIVIAQFPNPPLILAMVLFLLKFTGQSLLILISLWGTNVVMIYWSYLEVSAGVNTWRKILGLMVGGYSLYGLYRLGIGG